MSENLAQPATEERDLTVHTEAQPEPKLYAGKFDSVEKLENAYKEGFSVHLKNKELEDRLSKVTSVPEQYKVPEDVKLDADEINRLTNTFKDAKITQDQFDIAVKKIYRDKLDHNMKVEEKKLAVGQDKLNLVNNYIDESFNGIDDNVKREMFNKIIQDDKSLSGVLANREKRLNSTLPGIDVNSAPKIVNTESLLQEASLAHRRNPSDHVARARYISLLNQTTEAKK